MFAQGKCRQWSPYWLEYAQDRLPAPQKTKLEQHLQQCAHCRAQIAEYRQALELATTARQQPFPNSNTTWESLRLQLEQTPASSLPNQAGLFSYLFLWRRQVMGGGLALAGVAGVAFWMWSTWPHPNTIAAVPQQTLAPPKSDCCGGLADPAQIVLRPTPLPDTISRKSQTRTGASRLSNKTVPALMLAETGQKTHRLQTTPSGETGTERQVKPQIERTIAPNTPAPLDDLTYLNASPAESLNRWTGLTPARTRALEQEVSRLLANVRMGDDFVTAPLPQIAGQGKQAVRAALDAYAQEKAVVDTRLARKIRLGVKAMPLSTLLKQIGDETGIALTANARVADDNVTLFCHERSLRDIMRQLCRHFGFQWLREGQEGAYRYELTQSVRSQLLEEEARNQDQDDALIALDRAMEKYRKYRGMTGSALQDLEKTMKPEKFVDDIWPLTYGGWLPASLYFGLSPDDMQMLRAGQPLNFAMNGEGNSRPLPSNLRSEILNSFSDTRINPHPGASGPPLMSHNAPADSLPLTAARDIVITSQLKLDRSQLGRFTLTGDIFLSVTTDGGKDGIGHGITLAEVSSPAVSSPQNAVANAKHAHDPDLQKRVAIEPQPSCELQFSARIPDVEGMSQQLGKKCTTADVLEAIFKASGKDVIGDFYTRLYVPAKVTETNVTLLDALNRLGDTLHDRWSRDDDWLAFRSTSWFYDRPKEVPARKLARWAASRREHGVLTLDDLMEIGQLSNAQLDALSTFEGALARYNLQEWNFARSTNLRDHWRFLGLIPADMRLELFTGKELQANKLPLALQKKFIPLALNDPNTDMRPGSRGMENPTLRIEYPMGQVPPDRPNLKALMPSNPVIFVYAYGDSSRDKYDRRASLIGPFNATIGTFAARLEEERRY